MQTGFGNERGSRRVAAVLLLVCAHCTPPPVVLKAAKRNATVHGAGTAVRHFNELSKVLKLQVSLNLHSL